MERLVVGDIVIVPFPFSNIKGSKRRPALVVAKAIGNDILLAQITSQTNSENNSIIINNTDFKKGNLPITSYIKYHKLFSADKSIILYKAGTLKEQKIKEIKNKTNRIY